MSASRFNPELKPRLEDGPDMIGRQGKRYRPDRELLEAANTALTLERPLLLTGDPGCGKTDFAWAAAGALGAALGHYGEAREPLLCSVRSDSRARDLLYSNDAIRRFGDSQHAGNEARRRANDPRHYIALEPLGRALVSAARRVVLIDEIDKAPRDLPNDLLRELDEGSFDILEIPESLDGEQVVTSHAIPLERTMRRPRKDDGELVPLPLVIITSNVERQLPDAFLRRCIFHHIKFPEALLPDILGDHFPKAREHGDFLARAVAVFTALRRVSGLAKPPATAELLDWVGALTRVYQLEHSIARLTRVSAALDAGRVPWSELPGLSCLVKLREDLLTLAAA